MRKPETTQAEVTAPLEREEYLRAFREHALKALDEAARQAQERNGERTGLRPGVVTPR